MFNGTTAATHITDLDKVIAIEIGNGKTVIFILSDNGPDFNPMSLLNELYYYRLFKKLDLDVLAIMTYAARYSAFNPIEHLWAPMSRALSGVILPSTVEGEKTAPAKQGKLTNEERKEKEKVVFNDAMKKCQAYWEKLTFDNNAINTSIVKCGEDDLLYNDYERVQAFLKTSIGNLPEYSDLVKEFKEMFLHIDRHYNEIVFTKCNDLRCCKEWRAKDVQSYLEKHKMRFPAPAPSTTYESRYKSFLQDHISTTHSYGDDGQPSKLEKGLGKCEFCPNYSFTSKTEKDRHKSLFHRRQTTAAKPKDFSCNVCGAAFCSLPTLNRHKKKENHTARSSNEQTNQNQSLKRKSTTKQRSVVQKKPKTI